MLEADIVPVKLMLFLKIMVSLFALFLLGASHVIPVAECNSLVLAYHIVPDLSLLLRVTLSPTTHVVPDIYWLLSVTLVLADHNVSTMSLLLSFTLGVEHHVFLFLFMFCVSFSPLQITLSLSFLCR